MSYQVKEIFYTLQGEGARAGRAAVFLRFAGCNLWSGREKDRAGAVCTFCDTDFVGTNGAGGGSFASAAGLADVVASCWNQRTCPPPLAGGGAAQSDAGEGEEAVTPPPILTRFARSNCPLPQGEGGPPEARRISSIRYVVCTGGEPLLQLDEALIAALHGRGFEIAIESNGTLEAPDGIDWVCVSPKADAPLKLTRGNELKLVYPQPAALPQRFEHLAFDHFFLQPMDCSERDANTRAAVAYCLAHPQWRLSLQTHKLLGIP